MSETKVLQNLAILEDSAFGRVRLHLIIESPLKLWFVVYKTSMERVNITFHD